MDLDRSLLILVQMLIGICNEERNGGDVCSIKKVTG